MKTVIYYFTSTGNSLAVARDISDMLEGEREILPVAAYMNDEKIEVCADAVGIIFPVYCGDMPYAVRKAVERMTFAGNPYIFGVATYGGDAQETIAFMADIIRSRGQTLSAFYSINMPGNCRINTDEQMSSSLAMQKEHTREIAEKIAKRYTEDYSHLVRPEPTVQWETGNTRGMMAEETCIGCGICEKVCPMSNIVMENLHPVFGEKCISCMGCFHWCPTESIIVSKKEDIMRRPKYHHPDVTLEDIIAQKVKI